MTRDRILLLGGFVVVVAVILVSVAIATGSAGDALVDGSASGPPSATSTPFVPATQTTDPSDVPPSARPTETLAPTDPAPATEPAPTATPPPPRATGDPRLAYAEFLLRLDDARDQVQPLNAALTSAAQSGDKSAVRSTAVDILRFTDAERDWLLGHPPADCYAMAYDAAGQMLEDYATVADRAIDWTTADPGLDALAALGAVLTAADDAQASLGSLASALEATTCLP